MRYLALLGVAATMLVAAPGSSPRALQNTWSGTWATEWGTMTLTQNGSKVEGTYPHDRGHIVGTVSGSVFKGRWDEAPTRAGPNDAGLSSSRSARTASR